MDKRAGSRLRIEKKYLSDRIFHMAGISAESLQEHFKLYEGYVERVNEVRRELEAVKVEEVNSAFSAYRNLKRAEAIALNAVKLHELYFEQLGGTGGEPSGMIRRLIERDFGSFDNWLSEFTACAKTAGGWAVLAWDLDGQHLFHYVTDSQNEGNVIHSVVILAVDVYEHAYMMDHDADRARYIKVFFNNLDWEIVNQRTVEAIRSNLKLNLFSNWLTTIFNKKK